MHVLFLVLLIEKSWLTIFILTWHKVLPTQLKIKGTKLLREERFAPFSLIRVVLLLFFGAFNFIDFDFPLILRDMDLFEGGIGLGKVEFNLFAFSFLYLLDGSL